MLNRRTGRWLLGACVLACAWAAPGSAAAAPVLDQEFVGDLTPSIFTSCSNIVCGQSFTVGLTGTLTSAQLYINDLQGPADATVGIYSTTGSGSIDSLLASTVLLNSSFTSGTFYSFAFSLPVTAGDVLAIAAFTPLGSAIQFAGDGTPSYAFGAFTGVGFVEPGQDLYFRTYVDTAQAPEPMSLALFGVGLAGAGIRRWRRARTH